MRIGIINMYGRTWESGQGQPRNLSLSLSLSTRVQRSLFTLTDALTRARAFQSPNFSMFSGKIPNPSPASSVQRPLSRFARVCRGSLPGLSWVLAMECYEGRSEEVPEFFDDMMSCAFGEHTTVSAFTGSASSALLGLGPNRVVLPLPTAQHRIAPSPIRHDLSCMTVRVLISRSHGSVTCEHPRSS